VWYRGSITVPGDTAQADAVTAEVEVSAGTISHFYRLFPLGCAGMVHLQVFNGTRQIFPTTPGESYIGDGSEVLGSASIKLSEPPYILELCAWSPDTDYQHIVYVEFYIEKTEILIARPIYSVGLPE